MEDEKLKKYLSVKVVKITLIAGVLVTESG